MTKRRTVRVNSRIRCLTPHLAGPTDENFLNKLYSTEFVTAKTIETELIQTTAPKHKTKQLSEIEENINYKYSKGKNKPRRRKPRRTNRSYKSPTRKYRSYK
mgnify:CR=1 FL=1